MAPDDSDAIDADRVEILLRRVVVDDRDCGLDVRDVVHEAHDESDAVGGAWAAPVVVPVVIPARAIPVKPCE